MDCQDCKKLLSKFLDNELDKKQQLIMTKHIEDCPACAQALESITEMVNMMHKIKAINPPADFMQNVNKRLDALPFWERVLMGIKSVFFSNPPIKSFALVVSLILVFIFTGQLNNPHEKIENSDKVILSSLNADSGGDYFPSEKAKKQESSRAKTMLSEPANAVLELAETDISEVNINTDLLEKEGADNMYIKANDNQVLLLNLDDKGDIDTIKEMLSAQKLIDFNVSKEGQLKIFSFKTDYENFLRLHSLLAGFGQLEKATPNVEFYENSDNSMSWQKEAFKQLISVELKVLSNNF